MDLEVRRERDELKVSGDVVWRVGGDRTEDSLLGVGKHKMRGRGERKA